MDLVGPDAEANTLLIADAGEPCDQRACSALLDAIDGAAPSLIGVSLTETADQWLADIRDRLGTRPDDLYLLSGGEFARSAARAEPVNVGFDPADVVVRPLEDPRNLTQLGVALTDLFEEVTSLDESTEATMCFRSLSALTCHADPKPVFKFLNILTSHVASYGITAHYHLDPTAHDDQTVAQLKTVFDAVVAVDGSGHEPDLDRPSAVSPSGHSHAEEPSASASSSSAGSNPSTWP